ncbi:MAG: alpha/beta hydrolase, partial [Pseudomonadota bacterium]
GVHDLRPLLQLEINDVLKIESTDAAAESPALNTPLPGTKLICWVGAGERSEFIRQNALLANIWKGLGATTFVVEEPDRHHMNVVDGLADPASAMLQLLLDLPPSSRTKAI